MLTLMIIIESEAEGAVREVVLLEGIGGCGVVRRRGEDTVKYRVSTY